MYQCIREEVVSTAVSGILFAHFSTVECTPNVIEPLLIHSTVGKRGKRMPDTTVATTEECLKLILFQYFLLS